MVSGSTFSRSKKELAEKDLEVKKLASVMAVAVKEHGNTGTQGG
jgi:hypothetical protein